MRFIDVMMGPTLFELCARTVIYCMREELTLQDITLLDWYWSIPDVVREKYISPRFSAYDTRLWDLLCRHNMRIVTEQELQQAEQETQEDDYNYDEDYRTSRYYDSDDDCKAAERLGEPDLPDWL